MLYRADVPPKVAINEGIELSKQFGDDKSRNFINGILDAAAKALEAGTITCKY
jgi:N utilization substance protein B